MSLTIDRATQRDVDELLRLYFAVYGTSYPLALGSDRAVMSRFISSEDDLWLVMRDSEKKRIVGSCVFEVDRFNKIAKVLGLVVHPEVRRQNIGYRLVTDGTQRLLESNDVPVNSVYTTTRTNSVGVQMIFLKDGFIPLGIFPNAHRLKDYESLTLFAKFRKGVLDRREAIREIPEKLSSIVKVMNRVLGEEQKPRAVTPEKIRPALEAADDLEFEFIFAPEYVRRRFYATFSDPYDRFYPFHVPNLLLTSTNGEVEIYCYFSKQDRYCTIVTPSIPFYNLTGRIKGLFEQMKDYGISYLEILIGFQYMESIQSLLDAQFLPSAVYPAMQEYDGRLHDFVLLSRTLEPLNFRGMEIEKCFKPYVDQYVELWKQMHLDTLSVFDDYV